MPNEIHDREDDLQDSLQDREPSAETLPSGPPAGRLDAPDPDPAASLSAPADAASRQPSPEVDALRCSCGAVIPPGAEHCPGQNGRKCGRFTPFNTDSLVTGLRSMKLAKVVDAYRVDLIAQLFNERGGSAALDVVGRIAIENYALVCAQHKIVEARLDADGPFTKTGRRRSAFEMLKTVTETIDRLRQQLPPIKVQRPASADDVLRIESVIVDSATPVNRFPPFTPPAATTMTPPQRTQPAPTITVETPIPASTSIDADTRAAKMAKLKVEDIDRWSLLNSNHPDAIDTGVGRPRSCSSARQAPQAFTMTILLTEGTACYDSRTRPSRYATCGVHPSHGCRGHSQRTPELRPLDGRKCISRGVIGRDTKQHSHGHGDNNNADKESVRLFKHAADPNDRR